MLTRVRFPRADLRTGFAEVSRKAGDFALAGAAVALDMDGGTCRSARIALFGVSDRPVRATAAEQALAGRSPAQAAADAGRLAAEGLDTKSDGHASAQYRKEVAGVMVERAVRQAGGEG